MSYLLQNIETSLKAAMKGGDKAQLSALRLIKAALQNKSIELFGKLDDASAIKVLQTLKKQRADAAESFAKVGQAARAQAEEAEITVIEAFLPQPLTDDELALLITQVMSDLGAKSMKDMGTVMKECSLRAAGRAEGGKIAGLVKIKLSVS